MSIASGMPDSGTPIVAEPGNQPDSFWRTLKQLNAFRAFLALFFSLAILFDERLHVLDTRHGTLLLITGGVYLALAASFAIMLRRRWPAFDRQLITQLVADTLIIAVFMRYGGGSATGLGLVLMVPTAAAGLHSQPRIVLWLAAQASLAVLVVQTLATIQGDPPEALFRAGLFSVGLFTLAGISHILAKGALSASRIAGEKAQQAADLERINSKVIQDLPHGVLVVDRQGQVLQFNPQAEALIGCPLMAQGSLAACQTELANAWREWLQGQGPETVVITLADTGRRIRVRLLQLGPDRGEGAVVVIEDMSELEQVAAHMKLASLGRLTANLAHEIRNPLSAIHQAAQILSEDAVENPATGRLTRIIEDNVGRLNYLVEDVLSLSRRDRQSREAIELDPFMDDFLSHFRHAEAIAEGVLVWQSAPGVRILFDRMHLHQILWNLCRNAVRHCSGGPGSIRITATATGDQVFVEIYNDGPGIPADTRTRLFEPFYSTDKTGTGLGLYIAQDLSEANGGQLRCLEQNNGAAFRLTCKLA